MHICGDPESWLRAMAAPGVEVAVHDGGLPRRRFAATLSWDTGTRRLDDHLVYVVGHGEACLEGTGGGTVLTPGDCCLIPPGALFRVRAGRRAPRLLRLRLRVRDAAGPIACAAAVRVFAATAELRRVLDLLADSLPGTHAPAWDRAGGLLLAAALVRAQAARAPGALPEDAVARCRACVERDPHATPRDLARACGLSQDWFSRAFRRTVGCPPRRWLVEARVRLAAQELADGREPAWTVARRLGWSDAKLFGRQFRAVMGAPPGRWRLTTTNP